MRIVRNNLKKRVPEIVVGVICAVIILAGIGIVVTVLVST